MEAYLLQRLRIGTGSVGWVEVVDELGVHLAVGPFFLQSLHALHTPTSCSFLIEVIAVNHKLRKPFGLQVRLVFVVEGSEIR